MLVIVTLWFSLRDKCLSFCRVVNKTKLVLLALTSSLLDENQVCNRSISLFRVSKSSSGVGQLYRLVVSSANRIN